MKKNQITDLHQQTSAELKKQLDALEKELTKARLQLAAQKLENISTPDRLRKDVARIKTILREKELAAVTKDQSVDTKK